MTHVRFEHLTNQYFWTSRGSTFSEATHGSARHLRGLDKLLAAYYQLHPAQNGRLGMVDFGHMPWSKTMQMGNRHGRMCHEDSLEKSEFVISRNLGCAENLPLVECRFPMVKVPAIFHGLVNHGTSARDDQFMVYRPKVFDQTKNNAGSDSHVSGALHQRYVKQIDIDIANLYFFCENDFFLG